MRLKHVVVRDGNVISEPTDFDSAVEHAKLVAIANQCKCEVWAISRILEINAPKEETE